MFPAAVRDGHILPYLLFGSIEFLKLYLSFASYSLIAAGFAVLVGITPTMNFRAPLIAISLADFWMRWHISLTTWIRDRIFYPILLSLARWNNGEMTWAHYTAARFSSFIFMGAWHGLTKNFILYGLYHGSLLFAQEALIRSGYWPQPDNTQPIALRGALHVANSLFVFVILAMGMNIII